MALRIIKYTLLSFALFLSISSCYYDNEEELYPTPTVCNSDSMTYDLHIAPIINAKCAIPGCHNGSQSPNLLGYENVNGRLDRILNRAVVNKSMPPSSKTPLTDCEIKQIESWINNGAPQN